MGIEDFKNIDDKMLWKGAALHQIETFTALAERLDARLEVVSSHHSKSINLPVIRVVIGGVAFYVRDNFYDYNLCVVSPEPIELSISQLMDGIQPPMSWEWYLEEIAKCRGYTWDYFTDEEMDDPRILRVLKVHKLDKSGGAPKEWSVTAKQKDRWLKRMASPEWWEQDWSGGRLCWEGDFGPGVKLYLQQHPFMQGIERVVPADACMPYRKGCRMFALALHQIEQVETMIRKLSKQGE